MIDRFVSIIAAAKGPDKPPNVQQLTQFVAKKARSSYFGHKKCTGRTGTARPYAEDACSGGQVLDSLFHRIQHPPSFPGLTAGVGLLFSAGEPTALSVHATPSAHRAFHFHTIPPIIRRLPRTSPVFTGNTILPIFWILTTYHNLLLTMTTVFLLYQ